MDTPHQSNLFEGMTDTLSIDWAYIDTQFTIQQISKNFSTLLGKDVKALIGTPIKSILSPSTFNRLCPYWKQALEGHTTSFSDFILFSSNTEEYCFQVAHFPNVDDDGHVSGVYLCLQDHTQHNRTVDTLRKLHRITAANELTTKEKIEALLSLGTETFSLPIGIISEIHNSDYIIRYACTPNGEVKPGDQFDLGITYCIHTLNADQPTGFNHVGQSTIQDHPCYSIFGLESYLGTPLVVNGKRYGTLNFSSPTPRKYSFSHDDFELIRLFAQWISNKLSREQDRVTLERQSQLLESMSQQARIGAWEVDLIKGEIYWSKMTKIIHEVDDDYVPEMTQAINFYKEGHSRDRITRLIERAISTGESWHEQLQLITAKGNSLWVDAMGQVEMINGKACRLYGSFQDIDARVKGQLELKSAKDVAESAAASKSTFLANMSHEIRTPMNGVIGMLNLLTRSQLTDQQKHYSNLAQSSAESLLVLINDILDFSKIEAGKLNLEILDFNLIEHFSDFVQTMTQKAEERDLELILDCSRIQHLQVKGDPSRLRQVLTNLVSNALKFTHQGYVLIMAETIQQSNGSITLNCTVKDTGIGIPEEKLPHLFDAFTQADSSTTREYGGTGLGLAIVKQLCLLMGGDVEADSQENAGSCFHFSTTMLEVEQPSKQDHPAHLPEKDLFAPFLNQKTIWNIDQNAIKQDILNYHVKQWGADVKNFDDIKIPIEMLRNFILTKLDHSKNADSRHPSCPSIIFIDLNFVNTLEFSACEELKKLSDSLNIVVILEVPLMLSEHFVQLANKISHRFMTKPFTPWGIKSVLLAVQHQETLDSDSTVDEQVLQQTPETLSPCNRESTVHDSNAPLSLNQNGRILLVEDNQINQIVARDMLQDMGLDADIAGSGVEALKAIQKTDDTLPYELILMDCQMPEMDGYEATGNIRQGNVGDNNKNIPIIALTANAMKGDREKCIEAGMTDYLSKPISYNDLENMLYKYLPQR